MPDGRALNVGYNHKYQTRVHKVWKGGGLSLPLLVEGRKVERLKERMNRKSGGRRRWRR